MTKQHPDVPLTSHCSFRQQSLTQLVSVNNLGLFFGSFPSISAAAPPDTIIWSSTQSLIRVVWMNRSEQHSRVTQILIQILGRIGQNQCPASLWPLLCSLSLSFWSSCECASDLRILYPTTLRLVPLSFKTQWTSFLTKAYTNSVAWGTSHIAEWLKS